MTQITKEAIEAGIEAANSFYLDRATDDATAFDQAVEAGIRAALSTLPIAVEGEETEWHRADNSNGSALLYTLRENGWRKGQPVLVNDVMIRIERGAGSETDIEAIIQRILSALSSSPGKDGDSEIEIHEALKEVLDWLYNCQPDFIRDETWKKTERRAMAALRETFPAADAAAITRELNPGKDGGQEVEAVADRGEPCPHCKGEGCQPGDPEAAPLEACDYCNGSGKKRDSQPASTALVKRLTDEQLRNIADSKDTATCRARLLAALSSSTSREKSE